MATSSDKVTSGEVLNMAADIIKLLAPALKNTTPERLKFLKRRSEEVQEVFRRLLDGQSPVQDLSCLNSSNRIINTTSSVFKDHLTFEAKAVALAPRWPDSFEITIIILGVCGPLLTRKLSRHINWMGIVDEAFVSLRSVERLKSLDDIVKLRNRVQSSLITQAMELNFFKPAVEGIYGLNANLARTGGWQHTEYFEVAELKNILEEVPATT